MLYLSKQDIEIIGNELISKFSETYSGEKPVINIEAFAEEFLGLDLIHAKLSDDGKLLGLTTFCGVEIILTRDKREETIKLESDSILIEEALLDEKQNGRRRFTIAHECGHQIIDRLEEERTGVSVRTRLSKDKPYHCRELAGAFDTCEWQANYLAAVLIMPPDLIAYIVDTFRQGEKIKHFGWRGLEIADYKCVAAMAEFIGVSVAALRIRLGELGYYEHRPANEFKFSPYDIIPANPEEK